MTVRRSARGLAEQPRVPAGAARGHDDRDLGAGRDPLRRGQLPAGVGQRDRAALRSPWPWRAARFRPRAGCRRGRARRRRGVSVTPESSSTATTASARDGDEQPERRRIRRVAALRRLRGSRSRGESEGHTLKVRSPDERALTKRRAGSARSPAGPRPRRSAGPRSACARRGRPRRPGTAAAWRRSCAGRGCRSPARRRPCGAADGSPSRASSPAAWIAPGAPCHGSAAVRLSSALAGLRVEPGQAGGRVDRQQVVRRGGQLAQPRQRGLQAARARRAARPRLSSSSDGESSSA